jgi:hypothetical protein
MYWESFFKNSTGDQHVILLSINVLGIYMPQLTQPEEASGYTSACGSEVTYIDAFTPLK